MLTYSHLTECFYVLGYSLVLYMSSLYIESIREASPFDWGVQKYKLLVHHNSLEGFVIMNLGGDIFLIILYNNPGSFPKFHDGSEVAASFALFYYLSGEHF